MLYFHFCQKYLSKVSPEADKVIKKRIKNLERRNTLKGVASIFSYSGVSVLQTNTPSPMRTIIQEKKIQISDEGQEISVFFVQDTVELDDLQPYTEVRKGLWQLYNPVLVTDEDDYIRNFTKEYNKPQVKPQLPSHLISWLQDYKILVTYDIYETEEWVEFAMGNGAGDGMGLDVSAFNIVLREMLESRENGFEILHEGENIQVIAQERYGKGVVYSRIIIDQKPFFLLHAGAHLPRQKEHWDTCKNKAKLRRDSFSIIDDIGKLAIRAYPSWALKNDDLWRNIQKNSESGNLALLTEQTDYLRNFKFPAYINGQAGSGKSTMLYYLFANTYYYKCLGEIQGNVVFLSENKNLLESTKRSIRDLLLHNPEFELSLDYIDNIDQHFSTLKDFLLDMLEEEGLALFPSEKYLDFSTFKIKFEEDTHLPKSVTSKFTIEFIWFVITTYIIGYDFDTNITSKNYDDEMLRDIKALISKEEFIEIETKILPFYQKLIYNENYWDKIKIIRHIQKGIGAKKLYEVIFCDEAQDFSRIELKFILGLSEYLQYDLTDSFQTNGEKSNKFRVPIVFAGDPLQTVNPTGYRKEDVKELFYMELGKNLKNNEYKPKYNYRSSQVIVNLANAVQYFRKKELSEAGIASPQQTKQPIINQELHNNIFLSFESVLSNTAYYLQELEHKTVIVPVNPDEKEHYLSENRFLNSFVSRYSVEEFNGSKNYDLIKSSVEAKGVDYPQVIIYGFGEYCIQKFGSYGNVSSDFDAKFFFTKLYVAITRAQQELIIIDKIETLNDFWEPLLMAYADSDWQRESGVSSENIKKSILKLGEDKQVSIKKGNPDMALENAKRDKLQAERENNPTLMRMVASQFIKLGNKKEYFIAKALEYKLEGNYEKAAENYLNKEVGIKGHELAADIYWVADILEKFKTLTVVNKSEDLRLRLLLINFLETKTLKPSEIRDLEKQKSDLEKLLRDTPWRDRIIESLVEFSNKVSDREMLLLLITLFSEINTFNNEKMVFEIGHLQYRCKRFAEAIDTWSTITNFNNNDLLIQSHIEFAKQQDKYDLTIELLGTLSEKLTNVVEKEKIEKEIIGIYESNDLIIKHSNNSLTHLYVYGAFLMHKIYSPIVLELAQRAENKLVKKREIIVEYYLSMLTSGRLSTELFDIVLERWVKNESILGKSVDQINANYQKFTKETSILYQPYDQEEIKSIDEIPKYIQPIMSEHIENITIKNFRKFTETTIENLGIFNLIVGDNNIGKTSLLEAFLFTPDKKDYLQRLAFAYIERRNIQPEKRNISGELQVFYSLDQMYLDDFKNFSNSDLDIQFTFKQKRHHWQYKISKKELIRNDSSIHYLSLSQDDFKFLDNILFSESIKQPFMPYGKGFGSDLALAYSDEIASSIKNEKDFIQKLELFIPNIDRIKTDTKRGEIDILQKGADEYISLHQFGEGANKIFRILLLLTLHKGKRLMIDEIDAGIHYSRFKDFWKIILQVAQSNNTQIIATTHNDECIAYFTEALKELDEGYREKSRVIQCKLVADNLKIHSYKFESFNLAQERGVELRGGQS